MVEGEVRLLPGALVNKGEAVDEYLYVEDLAEVIDAYLIEIPPGEEDSGDMARSILVALHRMGLRIEKDKS